MAICYLHTVPAIRHHIFLRCHFISDPEPSPRRNLSTGYSLQCGNRWTFSRLCFLCFADQLGVLRYHRTHAMDPRKRQCNAFWHVDWESQRKVEEPIQRNFCGWMRGHHPRSRLCGVFNGLQCHCCKINVPFEDSSNLSGWYSQHSGRLRYIYNPVLSCCNSSTYFVEKEVRQAGIVLDATAPCI